MTHILVDLWQRLIKEAKVTLAGTREAILAISERVNRKTQTLRLHWQAATLTHQMEDISRAVGHALCDLAVPSGHDTGVARVHLAARTHLLEGATAVRVLKQELTHVEGAIRELELEALHEDLVQIQRDLTSRSAGLSRFVAAPDSAAVGLSLVQLNLPTMTHVAALLRGPTLLSPSAEVFLRAGDIVIFLGPQAELQRVASHFVGQSRGESRKAKAK
ncbi:MAG: TrkA C-terminal domain-containing protein [Nitrospirota bacterium]|nr:TrkA C-terminal domain-containing protein [Nitrospirota bacterium]